MTTAQARAEAARVVTFIEMAGQALVDGDAERCQRFMNTAHQYASGVRGYLVRIESDEIARRTATVAAQISGGAANG